MKVVLAGRQAGRFCKMISKTRVAGQDNKAGPDICHLCELSLSRVGKDDSSCVKWCQTLRSEIEMR